MIQSGFGDSLEDVLVTRTLDFEYFEYTPDIKIIRSGIPIHNPIPIMASVGSRSPLGLSSFGEQLVITSEGQGQSHLVDSGITSK